MWFIQNRVDYIEKILTQYLFIAQKKTTQTPKSKTDSNTLKYLNNPLDLLMRRQFLFSLYLLVVLIPFSETKHKWHDMTPISKLITSAGLLKLIGRIKDMLRNSLLLVCNWYYMYSVLSRMRPGSPSSSDSSDLESESESEKEPLTKCLRPQDISENLSCFSKW